MELVYLWVEEYKNIHKQGFNFSPRFECKFHDEYDEDGNLKDDCKLEIKSKEHIENFFGDNINVTAIVGKNGSGKSNLLKLIFNEHIGEKAFFIMKIDKMRLKVYGISLDKAFYPNNTIEITTFKESNSFKCNNLESGRLSSQCINFYTPLLQDSLIRNDADNKIDLSPTALLDSYLEEHQSLYFKPTFKTLHSIYKSNNIKNIIDMLQNNKEFKLPFKSPDKLTIMINTITEKEEYKEEYKFLQTKKRSEENFYEYVEQRAIKNWFEKTFDDFYQKEKNNVTPVLEKIKENFGESYSISNLVANIPTEYTILIDSKEQKVSISFLQEELKDIEAFIKIIRDFPNSTTNSLTIEIDKIPRDLIEKYNKLSFFFFSLDFSWYPELSTGQETFLSQFALFYKNKKSNSILLIDEGETTMHPDWQKKYINYMIEFFKNNMGNKNIHIILASHSPFILSDLPKENVIFLKDGEQVKGIEKKQTFGANIHTLLSDGFFMEEGLMGEFAKNKIQEIMDFLNSNKDIKDFYISQQQIKLIIESIGEDLLRMKLLDMYYEKFEEDELEKEKQQLLEKQKELKKLIESIEKKQEK